MAIDDLYMMNGHPTLITFPLAGGLHLFEHTLDPIGWSGGGPIDVTSMRNVDYRTQSPKDLFTVLASGVKTFYLPSMLDAYIDIMLENQLIVITWPTGDTVSFWGWIEEFKPETMEEGKAPMADVKIEVSNLNNSGAETGPVFA